MKGKRFVETVMFASLMLAMLVASCLISFVSAPQGELVQNPLVTKLISSFNRTELYNTVSRLQDFGTRRYSSLGNVEAAGYIFGRLRSMPRLIVEYQGNLSNVIATLPGVDKVSNATYIVGAHYDSSSTDPNLAPGANDNGCGVAVVLELARIMSKYNFTHTVKFAFWNAEEEGSLGSEDFVKQAVENRSNISLYYNFDSSGYDPYGRMILDVLFNQQSSWVSDILTEYNSLYGFNFNLTYNFHTCGSDWYRFKDAGYTSIWTHVEEHAPDMHTPNDTIDKVSFVYLEKNGQLGLSVLASLAEVLDVVPPVTANDYDGRWHNSDFTIVLSASDDFGVQETFYRVNNGVKLNVRENGQPRIVMEGSGNTLEYWSVDNFSNEEHPHKMLTSIKLDKTAPIGSIQVNNGASYTDSTGVSLSLSASDIMSGVFQMRLSNDAFSWSNWESYSSFKSWNLQPSNGLKNVYVQFKDNADLTATFSTSITLSTPIVANAGQDQSVFIGSIVTFDASPSTSSLGITSYSWDFGDGTTGTGVSPTHTYLNSGTYVAQVRVQDAAGNVAVDYITIIVQASVPEFPSAIVLIVFVVAVSVIATMFKRNQLHSS